MPMPTGRLLVVCKDDQALEVIDLPSGAVAGRVAGSAFTPHEVVGTRDGRRAYLPIYSDAYLGDAKDFKPLAFDRAGRLYVQTSNGRDKDGLYTFNLATGQPAAQPLFAMERYDFSGHPILRG